jgi:hypothetical protein
LNVLKFASVFFHRSIKFVLLVVAVASLAFGIYPTRSGNASVLNTAPASASRDAVDQSALTTARHLAGVAHGPDEQQQAAQALRVADHAVDQAFETALREATADTTPLQGEALATSQKIEALESTVEAEKQHVIALTIARLKTASQDDVAQLVEQAQAQLDLDTNRLNDLHQDLILLGGNKQAKVQQAFDEHDALQEKPVASLSSENDLESSQNLVTLPGKVRAFLEIRDREKQLLQAGEEATTAAARLTQQNETLGKEKESSPDSDAGTTSATATIDGLHTLSSQQKTMMEYDARIHDQQQLAAVYGSWAELAKTKRLTVLHGILQTLVIIVAIFLAVPLGVVLIRREFARWVKERRRLGHYPVIAELVVELLALAIILIVIFGTPTRIPIALGL